MHTNEKTNIVNEIWNCYGPFGDNGGKSAFCRCKKGVFDQKSEHFYPKSAYLESKFGHVSV